MSLFAQGPLKVYLECSSLDACRVKQQSADGLMTEAERRTRKVMGICVMILTAMC
jgi:hypothetical protein